MVFQVMLKSVTTLTSQRITKPITTEAMVADKPAPAAAPAGGGMPDMGGMGGMGGMM